MQGLKVEWLIKGSKKLSRIDKYMYRDVYFLYFYRQQDNVKHYSFPASNPIISRSHILDTEIRNIEPPPIFTSPTKLKVLEFS